MGSALLAAMIYKMRKRRADKDDEFVKTTDEKGIMESLYNPFDRAGGKKRGDKDDDFDHVL